MSDPALICDFLQVMQETHVTPVKLTRTVIFEMEKATSSLHSDNSYMKEKWP